VDVKYVGVHFGDSQLVLHRSLLPSGVIYVAVHELVPDFSSSQHPRWVFRVIQVSLFSVSWDFVRYKVCCAAIDTSASSFFNWWLFTWLLWLRLGWVL